MGALYKQREKKRLTAIVEVHDGGLMIGGDFKNKKQHYVWLSNLGLDGKLIWEKENEISELCSLVSLLSIDKKIIAIGGTCRNIKERIWTAIVSASGEIKLLKKFMPGKNEEIKQAILCGGNEFVAVGIGANAREDGSAAWIFKATLINTDKK